MVYLKKNKAKLYQADTLTSTDYCIRQLRRLSYKKLQEARRSNFLHEGKEIVCAQWVSISLSREPEEGRKIERVLWNAIFSSALNWVDLHHGEKRLARDKPKNVPWPVLEEGRLRQAQKCLQSHRGLASAGVSSFYTERSISRWTVTAKDCRVPYPKQSGLAGQGVEKYWEHSQVGSLGYHMVVKSTLHAFMWVCPGLQRFVQSCNEEKIVLASVLEIEEIEGFQYLVLVGQGNSTVGLHEKTNKPCQILHMWY